MIRSTRAMAKGVESWSMKEGREIIQRAAGRQLAFVRHLHVTALNHIKHRILKTDLLHPVYAMYEMTYACNLRCTYCDDGAGRAYPGRAHDTRLMKIEDVVRMLERLRREVAGIYLCGGEPTVHPQFVEILREVDRLGFRPVMLNTNGLRIPELLIEHPDLFRLLDILVFSLDSLNPDKLDRMLGSRLGMGQRILDALDKCLEKGKHDPGCTIIINSVVTKENVDDVREVAKFCTNQGVPFTVVPANRGMGLMDPLLGLPGYDAMIDVVHSAKGPPKVGPRRLYDMLLRQHQFECHPALRLHVTPEGKIPWPCQSDEQFALSILEYPSISALMSVAEDRLSIQQKGLCCGSTCYLAHNVSTDFYVSHPFLSAAYAFRDFILR